VLEIKQRDIQSLQTLPYTPEPLVLKLSLVGYF